MKPLLQTGGPKTRRRGWYGVYSTASINGVFIITQPTGAIQEITPTFFIFCQTFRPKAAFFGGWLLENAGKETL